MDTFYDEFEHPDCKNVDQFKKHHTREAVRAAILHNGQILMVHSTFGDYKFPGGGRDEGEEKEEALRRPRNGGRDGIQRLPYSTLCGNDH